MLHTETRGAPCSEVNVWLLLFVCVASSLFPVVQAHALDPKQRVSQYGHTAWRTQDGLVPSLPYITQTADGYIFMFTGGKYYHFDGAQFVLWPRPKGPSSGRSVTVLLGSHDGSLFEGTSGGLDRFNGGKKSMITNKADHAGINSMLQDHDGKVWFTRYRVPEGKGPICEVVGDGAHCYGPSDGVSAQYAYGVAEDRAGYLWFSGKDVYRWKHGTKATQYLDDYKHPVVADIAVDKNGDVWAAMDGVGPRFGVQYLHNGVWSEYSTAGFHSSTLMANRLFVDRDGAVWIGTENDGLYRIFQGVVEHFSKADGLSGRKVDQILEDREGNLWFSTDGGIDMFHSLPATTYSTDTGLSSASASSVLVSRDGVVWAGAYNGADWSGERASDILRPGPAKEFESGPTFPGKIQSIYQDHSGAIWVGLGTSLAVYADGKVERILDQEGRPLRLDATSAITEDSTHTILVLSQTYLYLIKDHHLLKAISLRERLDNFGILVAYPPGGVLIVKPGKLGPERKESLYQNGTLQDFHFPAGINAGMLLDVIADSADPLLFATWDGLFRWNGKRWQVLDQHNGLPCGGLQSLIKDRNGSLWIQGPCGLLKVEASELDKWRRDEVRSVAVTQFDVSDGVKTGRAFSTQPAMSLAPDGRLWFANGNTIESIDTEHTYKNNLPPPVHIEQLVADGTSYSAGRTMRIPPNPHNLEIDYTGLSFSFPRKVQFRYFLEGYDKDWQGPVTRRQAFYTDLAPGTYRFHVTACNNSGVWNEVGDVAEFAVAPKFYQTLWFRGLLAIAALCALWIVYAMRLKKATAEVSARLGERLQERERIARELHDTLLQDFQAVILRFQLVTNRLAKADPNRVAMDSGLDFADKVLAEGRNQIRDIRADTQATDELSKSLAAYGEELTQLWPLLFQLTLIGTQFELDPALRDDIYRIGREALCNAFKHSNGSAVEMEIGYFAAEFRMRVSDDGDGIDSAVVERGRSGHWGVGNMQERARNIGGILKISSRPNSGTTVELAIPLELAREARGSWFPWRLKKSLENLKHPGLGSDL